MSEKTVYLIIGGGITLLFFISTIAIKYGKEYSLITQYNTASKEERAKMDIKKLARFIVNLLYILTAISFAASVLIFFGKYAAGAVVGLLIVPVLLGSLIVGYKTGVFRKKARPKKSDVLPVVIMAAIFIILLTIFGLIVTGPDKPDSITLKGGTLSISGGYNDTIDVGEIKGLTLKNSLPDMQRRSGNELSATIKGIFSLGTSQEARVYICRGKPPYIFAKLDNSDSPDLLIFNFQQSSQTKAFYARLKAAAHIK